MEDTIKRDAKVMAHQILLKVHEGETADVAFQELCDIAFCTDNSGETTKRSTSLFALSLDEVHFEVVAMAEAIVEAYDALGTYSASHGGGIYRIANDMACGIVNRGLLGEAPNDGHAESPTLYRLRPDFSLEDVLHHISTSTMRLTHSLLTAYQHEWSA